MTSQWKRASSEGRGDDRSHGLKLCDVSFNLGHYILKYSTLLVFFFREQYKFRGRQNNCSAIVSGTNQVA